MRALLLTFCTLLLFGGCEIRKRGGSGDRPDDAAISIDDGTNSEEGVASADPDDDRTLSQQLEDASLSAHVKLALVDEKQLRPFSIEPEAERGVVSLHGELPSSEHRDLAERVARGVRGVRDIRNRIEAPDVVPPDTDTSAAAAEPIDTVALPPPPSTPATKPPSSEAPQEPPPADKPEESAAEYYTVKSGDSLWIIARRHNTTVAALQRLNNISGSRLRPGQRLRVR